jgi:hypothetical protein
MTAFLPLSVGETPSDLGWCHHTIRYRQRIAGASPCCWPGDPSDPGHALDLPLPATPRRPPARFMAWPHDSSAGLGRMCHTGVIRGHLFQSDPREITGEERRVRYEAMTSLRRRRLSVGHQLCDGAGREVSRPYGVQAASLDHDRVSHGSDVTSRPGRSGASRPDERFARKEKCMLT